MNQLSYQLRDSSIISLIIKFFKLIFLLILALYKNLMSV